MPPNQAKAESSKSSPRDSMTVENTRSALHAGTHTSTSTMPVHEPFKSSFRPQAPAGTPFVVNRFKLDNRPTGFRVVPPLPSGLADVSYTSRGVYRTYFLLNGNSLFPLFSNKIDVPIKWLLMHAPYFGFVRQYCIIIMGLYLGWLFVVG